VANADAPQPSDTGVLSPPAVARALIQERKWDEASVALEEATRSSPSDVNAQYWLGVARLQLHQYIGSVRALRVAQKSGIQAAAIHTELGHAYYGLHQYFLFEEQMRAASELDPRDFDAKYSLGLYRLQVLSDVAGASILFREAADLQPDDWRSSYQNGYCLELSGKPEEARQVYLKDMQLLENQHGSFGWPYQGMARLLLDQNPQEAARYAKRAVEIEPAEYSNHLILAKVYEQLGDVRNASAEGRIAADQNPTSAPVRYFLFMLYRRIGDSASAEKEMAVFKRLRAAYGSE
jgi:tetratricopeptide (TPR) repeat protein